MNHLKQILRKIDKLLDRKEIPAFIVGALFGVIIVEVEAIERQFIDDKRLCSEFFSPRDRLPKSEFGGKPTDEAIESVRESIATELYLSGTNAATLYCRDLILR